MTILQIAAMIIKLRCFIAGTRMERCGKRHNLIKLSKSCGMRSAHTRGALNTLFVSGDLLRLDSFHSFISFFLWKWLCSRPRKYNRVTRKRRRRKEIDAWKQFRKLLTINQFAIYFLFLVDSHWFRARLSFSIYRCLPLSYTLHSTELK